MSIILETEKVVTNGNTKGRIINKHNLKGKNDLPHNYMRNIPRCYAGNNNTIVIFYNEFSGIKRIMPGTILEEVFFQKLLKGIKTCELRLKTIETKRKELKKEWSGCEIIKI